MSWKLYKAGLFFSKNTHCQTNNPIENIGQTNKATAVE